MATDPAQAKNLQEAWSLLEAALEDDPESAGRLVRDLHAIRNGRDTEGTYDMLTWMHVRTLLAALSDDDIDAALGLPRRP